MDYLLYAWADRNNIYFIFQSWPEKYYPEKVICGYKLDKIDSFHEFVVYDEINRYIPIFNI